MVIRRKFKDDRGTEIHLVYVNRDGQMLLGIDSDQEFITIELNNIDQIINALMDIKYNHELDNLKKIE